MCDPHIETEAEYYAAFALERQGWNVGVPLRRNQKGFDLYAEKNGRVLRVQVKGRRIADRGISRLGRSFDVIICVRLRDNREPETFVATAEDLKSKKRWNPFPQRTAYLNRWDKLEGLRPSVTGKR